MAIMRWNPAQELARVQEEFERLFRNFLPSQMLETSFALGAWEPAVDICETNDEYVITAELPGVSKDEVKVSYVDEVLTISGERKQEEEKDKTYRRVERSFGAFERSFRLPARIVVDKIDAKFKDGVLTLTLPKAEDAKPKEIPIRVN
jgi:HSP20 family protein